MQCRRCVPIRQPMGKETNSHNLYRSSPNLNPHAWPAPHTRSTGQEGQSDASHERLHDILCMCTHARTCDVAAIAIVCFSVSPAAAQRSSVTTAHAVSADAAMMPKRTWAKVLGREEQRCVCGGMSATGEMTAFYCAESNEDSTRDESRSR